LEVTKALTPEKVCAIKHLIQPSVITSGDLKMALTTLNAIRDKLRNTFDDMIGIYDPDHWGYKCSTYSTKTTTITSKGSPVNMVNESPKRFIRYVRPTDDQGNILSFGGLTVYIDLDPENNSFRFSMSICGINDLFNKHIASTICKNRMGDGIYYKVDNYDQEISVLSNIYGAIKQYLYPEEFEGILNRPTLTLLPPKMKTRSLKQVVQLIEDYYSPMDMGSLHEILKGNK
jgi:hypothetical protein